MQWLDPSNIVCTLTKRLVFVLKFETNFRNKGC